LGDSRWYVRVKSQELGPFSLAKIQELVADGDIRPDTQLRADGLNSFVMAMQVPELGRTFTSSDRYTPPEPEESAAPPTPPTEEQPSPEQPEPATEEERTDEQTVSLDPESQRRLKRHSLKHLKIGVIAGVSLWIIALVGTVSLKVIYVEEIALAALALAGVLVLPTVLFYAAGWLGNRKLFQMGVRLSGEFVSTKEEPLSRLSRWSLPGGGPAVTSATHVKIRFTTQTGVPALARVTVAQRASELNLSQGQPVELFVQLSALHGKQVLAYLPGAGWQIGKWVGG